MLNASFSPFDPSQTSTALRCCGANRPWAPIPLVAFPCFNREKLAGARATMRRRKFITLLGGAAAWPLAEQAQQTAALPIIGFVGSDSPDLYAERLRAFRLGLKSTGFVEGQNVVVEYRWAEGQNDQLPALTADLVRRQVAVLVVPTTPSAVTAKAINKTIPMVFFTAGDPVDLGLVANLRRPDSNLTGATTLTLEVGSKWVQLLHEMVPKAASLALLINPTSPNLAETQSKDLQTAARSRGLNLHILRASTDQDLDDAFASVGRLGAGGLVISSDSFFFSRSALLAKLAVRHAVPTIFGFREFVAAGGLIELWRKPCGIISLGWRLYRPDTQGRKGGRFACPAVHEN
jgi:putative ABC transport system substrate-binding protein